MRISRNDAPSQHTHLIVVVELRQVFGDVPAVKRGRVGADDDGRKKLAPLMSFRCYFSIHHGKALTAF